MLPKIKICFILSHLPQGGAERQTINLIKRLDQSRYDITLLIYASKEIFYTEVLELPIHLIIKPANSQSKFWRNIGNAFFLRNALSAGDFDIIHTLLFHNGFWVRLVAPKRYNNGIIYSIRNSLKGSSRFELYMERILIRKSFVVTNSLTVMDQFLNQVGEKYKNRVSNIYNGIEIDKFLKDKLPEVNTEIIIGTVGRQTALKNQIQILTVINKISKVYPLHFYLIGDTTLDKSVDNRQYVINNNLTQSVTILNSQSDIEKYYSKFNIFILSSLSESCPNVLFEAMLARCLCIVSEGANSDHFIKDGINGFVYDGSTAMLESKLVKAIEMIRNDKINDLVDNGCKYVLDNFSVNKMVESYEALYKRIFDGLTKS